AAVVGSGKDVAVEVGQRLLQAVQLLVQLGLIVRVAGGDLALAGGDAERELGADELEGLGRRDSSAVGRGNAGVDLLLLLLQSRLHPRAEIRRAAAGSRDARQKCHRETTHWDL